MATASTDKRIVKVNGRNRRPWALPSKEKLLEAATAEIAAVGFDRARLTEIAARAEMTPGSVYTWFENKEDLFRAALEDALEKQIEANAKTVDPTAGGDANWMIEIGRLVPRNYKDKGPTDAQRLLIESYYASWRDPKSTKKVRDRIARHWQMYKDIVVRAQERGDIPTTFDADALATLFLAIPTGLSLLNLAGVPRIKDESWAPILGVLNITS